MMPAFYTASHAMVDATCAQCEAPADLFHIERVEVIACHRCRTFATIGSNLSSVWRHETERQWEERQQRIAVYSRVEVYGEYSADAPLGIAEKIRLAAWRLESIGRSREN